MLFRDRFVKGCYDVIKQDYNKTSNEQGTLFILPALICRMDVDDNGLTKQFWEFCS